MYRILIVEDDSTIASNVAAHLAESIFQTRSRKKLVFGFEGIWCFPIKSMFLRFC